MKKVILCSVAIMFSLSLTNVFAGDAAAGQGKAGACAGCHGPNGVSFADIYPNLKGQKEGYLIKQLKAFKDGSRVDPIMAGMAAGLSDVDMADIAAYFSGLK